MRKPLVCNEFRIAPISNSNMLRFPNAPIPKIRIRTEKLDYDIKYCTSPQHKGIPKLY